MGKEKEIRELLKKMASEVGPENSMLAQVKSVDEDALTCDLYDEESELDFYDVRLRPVVDGKEFLTIIPKLETWVVAVRIEDSDDWLIVSVGEADKWNIKCEEVVFNGGQKGGLVNWPDAKTQLDKCVQFIDAVKQVCGSSVNEAGNGAPSSFQAAMNLALASIQSPDFANLEDTKVKH